MSMSKKKQTEETEPNSQKSFGEMVQAAVEHTVIDFIRKGDWMKIDYSQKVPIDSAWLRQMHSQVDINRVMDIVRSDVEQRIADGILNSMAQEIANDCKAIMCNRELREDIRSVIRQKIREVESAIKS